MLEKYPKDVKIVFKNFPLSSHKFAQKAAAGALAAQKQGKFWEYHDKIFENYSTLDDQKLQSFAIDLGLDMTKFNQDMKSPETLSIINRDVREGQLAGVRGTPTIFVNGKLLKQRNIQGFAQMIDRELRKKK